MKPNEIGQFPYRPKPHKDSFIEAGYPKRLYQDGKWVPTFLSLGEVELIHWPEEGVNTDNCIFDLQSGNDACYYAALIEVAGVQYIWLLGNGWADLGFPFYDETFDPADPYKTGKGCYALIKGKAKDTFLRICKKDKYVPSYNNVFTGDIKADFCLPDK